MPFDTLNRLAEHTDDLRYPIRYRGRYLMLVVEEWVEEPSNEALARQLDQDSWWQRQVEWQRQLSAHSREENLHALRAVIRDTNSVPDPDFVDTSDEGIAYRLNQSGLPGTPSAVAYLRSQIEGHPEGTVQPQPARGLLVTTLVYGLQDEQGDWQFNDAHPGFEISGSHEFTTKDLLEQAYTVVAKHRTWLQGFNWHPLTTLSERRRVQKDSFATRQPRTPSANTDYRAAALDEARLLVLAARIRNGENRAIVIKDHLRAVEATVGRARDRHGLPRIPAKTWKPPIQSELRRILPS